MATYRGVDGSMTYSGTTGELQGWTIRSAVDVLDTTKMGSQGYKSFVGGLVEWDGTADVNLDLGDASQLAMFQKLTGASPSSSPVAAEFLVGTGKKFTGNIVVTQATVTNNVRGITVGAITFKGSGTLTIAWA